MGLIADKSLPLIVAQFLRKGESVILNLMDLSVNSFFSMDLLQKNYYLFGLYAK